MDEILYVGFYADIDDDVDNRNCSLAAVNLMNYVAKAIGTSHKVTIVSPSWTKKKEGFYASQHKAMFKNVSLKTGPTIGSDNFAGKFVAFCLSQLWLLFYLTKACSRNTKIIVYHSPLLFLPILLAKKLTRYTLILQVCEIYQDAGQASPLFKLAEKSLISIADRYILATKNLRHKFNIESRPFCVCGGLYEAEKKIAFPENDGKVHVVYSGVIDRIKKGAFNAVQAARFLDNSFHVHIVGFGDKDNLDSLISLIGEVNDSGNALVTFDGMKTGEELNAFLQKCHIGLSTQSPDGEFNNTSFPAKIFTYIANGLSVVSVDIKVIKESSISPVLFFYHKDDPGIIANAIRSASRVHGQAKPEILKSLDIEFKQCMAILLSQTVY